MCPAWGRGEARGNSYLSSIASHRPCLPTCTPSHAPPPSLTPRVLPSLGIETLYKYLCCLALSLSKAGSGVWPPLSGELTLAPLLSVPPPTPHPFIVNSHFCTGLSQGTWGVIFFFSLCWHLRPLEAWPTSQLDLGEFQDVSPHLPPMLRISRYQYYS